MEFFAIKRKKLTISMENMFQNKFFIFTNIKVYLIKQKI